MYLLKSGFLLHPVRSGEAEGIWPKVRKFFEDAIEKTSSEITVGNLLTDVINSDRQLWLILNHGIRAAALTHTTEMYGKKYCTIAFAGGEDHTDWVEIVEPIGKWAKELGCEALEIIGRRGWEKSLQPYGFQFKTITLQKRL